MKKKTYSRNRDVPVDSFDESEDYSGPDSNAPKRSPMRRKEKFRTKHFQAEKKQYRERNRGYRNKMQYDFVIWEE